MFLVAQHHKLISLVEILIRKVIHTSSKLSVVRLISWANSSDGILASTRQAGNCGAEWHRHSSVADPVRELRVNVELADQTPVSASPAPPGRPS